MSYKTLEEHIDITRKAVAAIPRKTVWFIQSGEGDPVPHYYTAKRYGASLMFVPEVKDAYKFETEEAAQVFANARMSHMRVTIVERKNG